MKKIVFIFLYLFSAFYTISSAQTDTLQLLTNNSSKEWFYKEILGDGKLWEEDGVNMCMYQTKIVFKSNGLFDKISPCTFPSSSYNNVFSVSKDTLFWNYEPVFIISITEDTLRLYEKAFVKVNNVVTDTIEWNFMFISSNNSTEIPSMVQPNDFTMYPNPCKNQFSINGLTNYNNIMICNEKGQMFYVPIERNGSVLHVDTSSLESGIYQCIIGANKNNITKSFIKL
ncbi:MAG: hypothetical protein BWY22_01428 [Bacteroidetes bacterium ADurb.Bin217]|nr:MAG: hypothetical protein BWY22_01428 [Bacteroidetes bacterium ADurb.Bin217]